MRPSLSGRASACEKMLASLQSVSFHCQQDLGTGSDATIEPNQSQRVEGPMRKLLVMAALAIAPAAVIAQGSGQPSDTHPGRALFKGSDYLRMSPDEQLGYVSGVIDGILFHSPFVDIFEHCFERLRPTPDLLKTIADRYLESEPELQKADMRFLVFHATLLTCQGIRQLPN